MDTYKAEQIDEMIKDIRINPYSLAKLHSDNSKSINIEIEVLEILKAYYQGTLEYSLPISASRFRDKTTTELFNIFHDEYKEILQPHWMTVFCKVSGIPKEYAEDCYWHNKELPNNDAINARLIEYLNNL